MDAKARRRLTTTTTTTTLRCLPCSLSFVLVLNTSRNNLLASYHHSNLPPVKQRTHSPNATQDSSSPSYVLLPSSASILPLHSTATRGYLAISRLLPPLFHPSIQNITWQNLLFPSITQTCHTPKDVMGSIYGSPDMFKVHPCTPLLSDSLSEFTHHHSVRLG